MDSLYNEKVYTIDDILALPDGERAELIDGEIYYMTMPSRRMDYFLKLVKYADSGVREYWIIDPVKESIVVHNFEKETMEEYSFGQEVPAGIYEGFSIII